METLRIFHVGMITSQLQNYCGFDIYMYIRQLSLAYVLTVQVHKFYLLITIHSSDTAPGAVFAGSMQLLAGVKLCTGRTITNHPHFENKLLRERTVQVYDLCMHVHA